MPDNTASAPVAAAAPTAAVFLAVSAAPIVPAKRRQPSYCSLVVHQQRGQVAETRHFDNLDDAIKAFDLWFHINEMSVKRIMRLRMVSLEDIHGWWLPVAYCGETEYACVETVYLLDDEDDEEDAEGDAEVADGGEEVEERQEDEEEAEEEASATPVPTDARSQTVGRTPTPPAESHAPSELSPAVQASF